MLSHFFKKKEKFFLLYVYPKEITGAVLGMDNNKRLVLERSFKEGDVSIGSMGRFARRFEKNTIVGIDSRLSFTASHPVPLTREGEGALSITELQNLLSQAVAKVFNQCREQASVALGVEDVEVVLVKSRVSGFRVDGHRVMNPVGFSMETLEAILELTLTTRSVLDRVYAFWGGKRQAFFTELDRSSLVAMQKIAKLPITILRIEEEESRFFVLEKSEDGECVRRGVVSWGTNQLLGIIEEKWGISSRAARVTYQKYIRGHASPSVIRFLSHELKVATQKLFSLTDHAKLKGTVCVEVNLPLPFALPHRSTGVVFTELPFLGILERLGIIFSSKHPWVDSRSELHHLAPFLEFYYDNSDSTVNHWLRRQLEWLGATHAGK